MKLFNVYIDLLDSKNRIIASGTEPLGTMYAEIEEVAIRYLQSKCEKLDIGHIGQLIVHYRLDEVKN